jgi:chromosome segregation ATPase
VQFAEVVVARLGTIERDAKELTSLLTEADKRVQTLQVAAEERERQLRPQVQTQAASSEEMTRLREEVEELQREMDQQAMELAAAQGTVQRFQHQLSVGLTEALQQKNKVVEAREKMIGAMQVEVDSLQLESFVAADNVCEEQGCTRTGSVFLRMRCSSLIESPPRLQKMKMTPHALPRCLHGSARGGDASGM